MERTVKDQKARNQGIERAEEMAEVLRQENWFYSAITLGVIYYLTYKRFLTNFTDCRMFNSWKGRNFLRFAIYQPSFSDFLDHFFYQLPDKKIFEVIGHLEELPAFEEFMVENSGLASQIVFDEEFASFIEHFLMTKLEQANPDTPIPPALAKLLLGLFDLPPNATILNPFAGSGSLIQYLPKTYRYQVEPVDPFDTAIILLRLLVHRFFTAKDDLSAILKQHDEKPDLAICFPSSKNGFLGFFPQHSALSTTYIENIVKDLLISVNEKGKVLMVVNDQYLVGSSSDQVALQKAMVNSGYLHAIISLPSSLFESGGIGRSLVVLDREKDPNGPVTFSKAANANKDTKHRDLEQLDVEGTILNFREKRFGNDVFEIPVEKIISWSCKLSPRREML